MKVVIRPSPIQAASEILKERFSEAKVIFLAGSALRGEQTPYSDLDLVVVYDKLAAAWRQSFIHKCWPVVHDPETLTYFFWEMDRPLGVPSLAAMVAEGKRDSRGGQLFAVNQNTCPDRTSGRAARLD